MNNFSTNRYIYVSVMGLTEIPAYLIPTPILMVMGRRTGSGSLYIIAALCLLCILVIPTTDNDTIMIISLIGRFSASAAYGIAILYSSELFPTVNTTVSYYYKIANFSNSKNKKCTTCPKWNIYCNIQKMKQIFIFFHFSCP